MQGKKNRNKIDVSTSQSRVSVDSSMKNYYKASLENKKKREQANAKGYNDIDNDIDKDD